jgi:hypothetical protein
VPPITLSPSSDARLLLSQYDDQSFPQFRAVFQSAIVPYKSAFIVVSNQSQQPIMMATVVWMAVDQTGRRRTFVTTCDGYASTVAAPIAPVNSPVLVGPQTCMPESAAARYAAGGGMTATAPNARGGLLAVLPVSTKVTIGLDVAVLVDGEVVGPDTQHKATDAIARATAAAVVSREARSAISRGVDLRSALFDLVERSNRELPPSPQSAAQFAEANQTLQVARWIRTYADRLTASRYLEADLRFIESRLGPPSLFRRNGN